MPPAFVFVGIIWRDVFGNLAIGRYVSALPPLYVAAARVFHFRRLRWHCVASAYCCIPNALIAAPLLGAYVIWPNQFAWKRAMFMFVPAIVGFFALVQLVYYNLLGATRQHPLQSIMVFGPSAVSVTSPSRTNTR